MTKPKINPATKMKNDLAQFKAQDIGNLAAAHRDVAKLTMTDFMGSGVIVTITNLSGKTVIEPVLIMDGLSFDTANALQRDIKRTYDLRLSLNKISE